MEIVKNYSKTTEESFRQIIPQSLKNYKQHDISNHLKPSQKKYKGPEAKFDLLHSGYK